MRRTVADRTQPRTFKGGVLYVEGAAELFNTTPKAIRAKVARRLLPFHKLDGRVIFFRDELEEFLRDLPGCSVGEAQANVVLRSGEAVML
jgi:hypothetical protein